MEPKKPFALNPLEVSKENKRKIESQYKHTNENTDQNLWESTLQTIAKAIKWDEYLLAERYPERRKKLQRYYKYLFPFEDMCTWLCYRKIDTLHCREFSYVMMPKRFRRYKTFDHFREMKFEIYKICPVKIDIGAIFNVRPFMDFKNKKMIAHPVERELIFDIDLSDYNTIRSCCKAEKICQKCWNFVAVAVKIMHTSFVEDFGWKNILWVFSGRRGIHCWVCDPGARRLSEKERKIILNYYKLEKPGLIYDGSDEDDDEDEKDDDDDDDDDGDNKPQDPFERKHVGRSYIFAKEYFVKVCLNEQEILRTPKGVQQFMSLLPTLCLREKVTKMFAECSTSWEKWNKFANYWKSKEQYQTNLRELRPNLLKHIILWYLYPRIDGAVSTGMNHLLKAPFSFHPTTSLLCTPFDPFQVDEFKVDEVPRLEQLIKFTNSERPANEVTSEEKIQRQRYEESRQVFSTFVKALEKT